MTPPALSAAAVALALFVSLLWGGNVAALKFGLDTFPAFWSAFWRFLGAAVAVFLWAKLRGVRLRPETGEWGPLVFLSLWFTAQISLLNIGAGWTSAGYAVVLLNAHPLFTNLFGQFVSFEEKLDARRAVGLALAFAGVCWLALGRPEEHLAPRPISGNVLMTISGALLAARVLHTRRIVQTAHPLKPVIWQMLMALPFFFAVAVITEPPTLQPVEWPAVAAILYQGLIVGGVCFVVWTTLLRTYSASTLSMVAFSVPFFGVLWSVWLFDEAIGGRLIGGAALVTAGIVFVTRAAKKTASRKSRAAAQEVAR